MANNNVTKLHKPENSLNELLKQRAQELLAKAIQAERQCLLADYSSATVDGRQAVVRNGYRQEPSVQTGLGDIKLKLPNVSYDDFWCMRKKVCGVTC